MSPAATFYRPIEGRFNPTLRVELDAGVVRPDEPEGLNLRSTFAILQRTASLLLEKAPRLGAPERDSPAGRGFRRQLWDRMWRSESEQYSFEPAALRR